MMTDSNVFDFTPSRKVQTIYGEPSFTLGNPWVKLAVTREAGHLGPVSFEVGEGRWVAPYALAPWEPDQCGMEVPPILRILRGDFFCLPFGDNGDGSPVHGETANWRWKLSHASAERLQLTMELARSGGSVAKTIAIRPGERAVYQEHQITGLRGKFNFGHHAILQFPETGGPFYINVSPFKFGSTRPDAFTNPALGEYSALRENSRFRTLDQVPLATGGTTDLRQVPGRSGYEDLAMVTSRAEDFAWTAATLDGYIWLSLKDPALLPSTLFWFSNGGRHYAPWNGRHRGRVGLEEVCSHFNDGLKLSRQDLLRAKGIPTSLSFSPKKPTRIRLIQVVHPVPTGFGMVTKIQRKTGGNGIRVSGSAGQTVEVPVQWSFLREAGIGAK
jgi:hypothetical protein